MPDDNTDATNDGPIPVEILPVDSNGQVTGEQAGAVAGAELYYFDGESGCDQCVATTGYYLQAYPPRPHPFCRCTVTVLVAADLGDDTCEIILLNPAWSTRSVFSSTPQYFYNYNQYGPLAAGGAASPNLVERWDAGLKAFVEAHSWMPPTTGRLSYSFDIPARRSASWSEIVERVQVDITADKYLVCPGGPADEGVRRPAVIKKIGVATGSYAVNVGCNYADLTFKKLH